MGTAACFKDAVKLQPQFSTVTLCQKASAFTPWSACLGEAAAHVRCNEPAHIPQTLPPPLLPLSPTQTDLGAGMPLVYPGPLTTHTGVDFSFHRHCPTNPQCSVVHHFNSCICCCTGRRAACVGRSQPALFPYALSECLSRPGQYHAAL